MEKLKKKLSSVYTAEQKLLKQTKELILAIVEQISDAELDGVKPIKSPVQCATISLSTIMQYKTNLNPEFYMSASQTLALRERMTAMNTLSEVQHFVDEAINNRFIKIKGEKVQLNPAVVEKLISIQNMF